MKKSLFLAISFCTTFLCAQNLVPNPDFELNDNCPTGKNELTVVNDWFNAAQLSPDYFNSCADFMVSIPENIQGEQLSFNGEAYIGIFCTQMIATFNVREYLTVELSAPLQAGATYYVSFYVNLSDYSGHAINQLGAYFSTDVNFDYNNYLILAEPQITNSENVNLTDQDGWMAIQGTYTPSTSGERFMTIGNFLNDEESIIDLEIGLSEWAYYYIDGVYVSTSPVSTKEQIIIDYNLYPNPTDDFTYIEFDNPYQINHDLKLYNNLGQQLQYIENISTSLFEIDCRTLPSGLYHFELGNQEGQSGVGSLIVVQN